MALVGWTRLGRPPTDFELLKAVYELHRDEYRATGPAAPIFLPINIPQIATNLGVADQIVFGRLYYHLDLKYAQEPDPAAGRTARKSFFAKQVGDLVNAINFPLLEAVLAGLWQERRRNLWVSTTAVVSIGISIAALIVSIAR
jgi:hypothetical protein